MNSIRSKLLNVALRRRVFPHRRVHCRRNQHGSGTSEISRAEKVVSNSIRKLCEDIRGRGRDDQQINGLRKRDMSDWIRIIGRVIVDNDVTTREGAKREWLHKLARPLRHRDSDRAARSLQSTEHFDGLVGSDTATDTKRNALDHRRSLRI
jgi:hypothetical protein